MDHRAVPAHGGTAWLSGQGELLRARLLLSLQPLKLLWGESVRHPHIPRMQ